MTKNFIKTFLFISLCCLLLHAQGHGEQHVVHTETQHPTQNQPESETTQPKVIENLTTDHKEETNHNTQNQEENKNTHAEGGHESSEHGSSEHDQPLILLFVFFGLLSGSVLRELNKKTKFPYTPMLIILGIIMGRYYDYLGKLGRATEIFSNIHPHMLLFVFIPVLIFESAFNCDWQLEYTNNNLKVYFQKTGPGCLYGAVLIAIIFKIFLGYTDDDMSWSGALMAGSVLSATDPVAVVALLKELGASPKFGTLIEGESLLNDGSAMVFYLLFYNITIGNAANPQDVITNFVRLAGGGPALGILFGLLSSLWLRRVIRDEVLVSIITFLTCYLVFFIAEFTEVKVSGILALVVLGLFMSAYGKTSISSQAEHAVHTVWSFLQYGCETIIFLLTGVIIGVQMSKNETTITFGDWMKLLIFYILSTFARGIMVATFIPCLRRSGYGLNNKEFYVLVWGGLRGALGITLGLMVAVDMKLDQRLRELTIFYMAGLATLTLLINGTTCMSLCLWLNLIENPPIKIKLLKNAKQQLLLSSDNYLENLAEDKYLNLADWKEVNELIDKKQLTDQVFDSKDIQLRGSQMEDEKKPYGDYDPKEVQSECRFRLLRTLKGLIWERYEKGHTSAEGTRLLDYSCNIALDNTGSTIQLWSNTFDYFTQFSMLKLVFKFKNWPILGDLSKNYITEHLALIYEVATTFILCCTEAKEIQIHSPYKNSWIVPMIQEIDKEVEAAEAYLSELMETYQNIVISIHTKRAAMEMIEHQQKYIVEQQQAGYLEDKDFIIMRKYLDQKVVKLQNHVFDWKQTDFHYFAMEFPIFKVLTKTEQRTLKLSSKEIDFKAGQIVFKQGDPIKNIYVLMKGSVKDQFSSFSTTNGIGSLLNYGNLVYQKKNVSTCTAVTDVTLKVLDFELLKKYMELNQAFEEKVYKGALLYCVRTHKERAKELGELTERQITKLASDSATKLERLVKEQELHVPDGGYIFYGEVIRKVIPSIEQGQGKVSYGDLKYVPAGENLVAKRQTYILVFSGNSERNITLEEKQNEIEKKIELKQIKESSKNFMDEEKDDEEKGQGGLTGANQVEEIKQKLLE